ncbi:MAG: GNAT family N-acetyltransferase [Halobacteriaceae archaeon]
MEHVVLGWPGDEPTLQLDHRRFAYAGKFVISRTGKAVAREDGAVIAAVAFDEDRADESVARLRYVTVVADRRGEGIGPRLCRFTTARLHERGYDTVRIAVNNPIAYVALYRAGFGYTGTETGLAELVLVHPGQRRADRYREGLAIFEERDLDAANRAVLERYRHEDPPPTVEPPD